MKSAAIFTCLMLAGSLPVLADIKARITYDKNSTADIVNPVLRDNAFILPQGALPLSRISRMDFEFGDGLTAQQCETLFNAGAFDQLDKLLTGALKQADSFAGLPGNLDVYLTWQMKVQFWNGRYAEMNRTADFLIQRKAASAGAAGMYAVLAAIEQKPADEAVKMFAAADKAADAQEPMILFVRARLAAAGQEYREALQLLARIVVLHDKDPEWMPAATLYEGLIYKRTGCPEAAGNIAKELTGKYPDGYWNRRAEELK